MAKFLPARLLRRFSSNHHDTNADAENDNDYARTRSVCCLAPTAELRRPSSSSFSSSSPSPPLPLPLPLPYRPVSRKSWALHRRHSSLTAGPDAADLRRTRPPSHHPRAASDGLSGVVLPDSDESRQSRPSPETLDGNTPIASTEELRLHFQELKEEIPLVTVHEATSAALEQIGEEQAVVVIPSNPGCPVSSEITLAVASNTGRSRMANTMTQRKVWVKRPGASPTQVQYREGDLVDDVRDVILRKYGNSLGRTFDSPDMTINIISRPEHASSQRAERVLGPEEEMDLALDACYPGGQTIDEALIINVPFKRSTPRPSPRVMQSHSYQAVDEYRPLENGTDYFPPMSNYIPATIPQTTGSHESRPTHSIAPVEHTNLRSMSVLNSGQVPPLPSPTALGTRRRPKFIRQPTSPTVMSHAIANAIVPGPPNVPSHRNSLRPRIDSSTSDPQHGNGVPPAPPLPTPPAPEAPPTNRNSATPPPLTPASSIASHLHKSARPRRSRKPTPDKQKVRLQLNGSNATGLSPTNTVLDGSVPPINVLIVEDNIINLRILEGLMKRLKVRWQTALNGKIAVDKWRLGGYHLVLMDIQMPVMTGLQATKEIRRLERVNGIGVFSSSAPASPDERPGSGARHALRGSEETGGSSGSGNTSSPSKPHNPEDDKLSMASGGFKSPVIIVALTASSLQSDRHEALAVGCNDFLTKPVNFVWLERKVLEWGCMQALIDFEGWRRWREQAAREDAGKSVEVRRKDRERDEKERARADKMAKLQEKQAAKAKEEKERKKRLSLGLSEASGAAAVANTNGGGGGGSGSGNTSATASVANSTVGASDVSAPAAIAAES